MKSILTVAVTLFLGLPSDIFGIVITPAIKRKLDQCKRVKTIEQVQHYKIPCRDKHWKKCMEKSGDCSKIAEIPAKLQCQSILYACRQRQENKILTCQRIRSKERKYFDRQNFVKCKEEYEKTRLKEYEERMSKHL